MPKMATWYLKFLNQVANNPVYCKISTVKYNAFDFYTSNVNYLTK